MIKNNPLVSVLIPIYNVSPYIEESINSILNQTYTNIEIIAIDDCSTDNTFEIVKSMATKDRRLKVLKNSVNLKISKTLNIAYKLSKGEFILRMDGDDVSSEDRIEKKLNFLFNNQNIDLVGCSTKTISADGEYLGKTKMPSDLNIIEKLLPFSSPIRHIWLARRSVYEKLHSYRDIPGVEDYDFLLRARYNHISITNVENYFGYSVRIGREGSTISTLSYKQLILKKLVYKDFKSKYKTSVDYEKIVINKHMLRLHAFSSLQLQKAIEAYSRKNIVKTFYYLALAVMSPYQVRYLFERVAVRYLTRKYKV